MYEKNSSEETYALGRSSEETRRLQEQDQMLKPFTRRLFEQAGIGAGMKVLDVGSGAGDVALLLAEMVGPGGIVVGVEKNPAILDTARSKVTAAGWSNVTFLAENVESIELDGEFDAIVGRLVLMYLRSPAGVLRRLVQHLRPGGIVAFQEPDFAPTRALHVSAHPPCHLWEQTCHWIVETFHRTGVPMRMGLDMYITFLDAELPPPHLEYGALIGAGANWSGYEYLAGIVRSMLPLLLDFGIATAEEVAVETLAERLRAEVLSQRAVVRGMEFVSAWAREAKLSNEEG